MFKLMVDDEETVIREKTGSWLEVMYIETVECV